MSLNNDQAHMKLAKSESQDEISNLPNEVLGRILSLMPTKDAVATCVLSSKWRNHYKLVDNLDLDDLGASHQVDQIRKMNIFWIFVSKVLSECKESNISKFRLKCGADVWLPLFEDLIGSSCLKEVEELDLSFQTSPVLVKKPVPTVLLPLDSVWQKLKVLKLICNIGLAIPKAAMLPNLREFFLKGVTLVQDLEADGLSEFLSKCPLLEEVYIHGCDWKGTDLYLSSPLLRRFTLEAGPTIASGGPGQFKWGVVHLDAPGLLYLRYGECFAGRFVIHNLSSVVHVHLHAGFSGILMSHTQYSTIYDLMKGVLSCKSLYLSSRSLSALARCGFEMPFFLNLTHLEVGFDLCVQTLKGILKFLFSSPALEVLTMNQDPRSWHHNMVNMIDDGNTAVPLCVKSRLKFIIHRFIKGNGDLAIIKYFLANANVLEELSIYFSSEMTLSHVEQDQLIREILKLPKASKSCSITFG